MLRMRKVVMSNWKSRAEFFKLCRLFLEISPKTDSFPLQQFTQYLHFDVLWGLSFYVQAKGPLYICNSNSVVTKNVAKSPWQCPTEITPPPTVTPGTWRGISRPRTKQGISISKPNNRTQFGLVGVWLTNFTCSRLLNANYTCWLQTPFAQRSPFLCLLHF